MCTVVVISVNRLEIFQFFHYKCAGLQKLTNYEQMKEGEYTEGNISIRNL